MLCSQAVAVSVLLASCFLVVNSKEAFYCRKCAEACQCMNNLNQRVQFCSKRYPLPSMFSSLVEPQALDQLILKTEACMKNEKGFSPIWNCEQSGQDAQCKISASVNSGNRRSGRSTNWRVKRQGSSLGNLNNFKNCIKEEMTDCFRTCYNRNNGLEELKDCGYKSINLGSFLG